MRFDCQEPTSKTQDSPRVFEYLRNGSNPVTNSGHGAYADMPAIVSGQHSHPSHVPGQYFPRLRQRERESKNNEIKCRQIKLVSRVNESCQLCFVLLLCAFIFCAADEGKNDRIENRSVELEKSKPFMTHQKPLPNVCTIHSLSNSVAINVSPPNIKSFQPQIGWKTPGE